MNKRQHNVILIHSYTSNETSRAPPSNIYNTDICPHHNCRSSNEENGQILHESQVEHHPGVCLPIDCSVNDGGDDDDDGHHGQA